MKSTENVNDWVITNDHFLAFFTYGIFERHHILMPLTVVEVAGN